MAFLPDSIRRNNILIAAVVALAFVTIWYLRLLFLYIAVAAVLALIVQPLAKQLERILIRKKKLHRSLRALMLLLTIYIFIFAFISIFIPVIIDEARIISAIDGKQVSAALHEPLAELDAAFSRIQEPGGQEKSFEEHITVAASELLNFTQVSSFANRFASAVTSLFVAFFAISFFTFFFIRDGSLIFEMMMLLVPPRHEKSVRNIFDDTQVLLTKYFTGVLIDIIFVASFVSGGMWILGIRNAIIIGIFAGIMNIIPYAGALISGAFAIIIAASTNLHLEFYSGILPLLGKVMIVFMLVNLIDGFLVQPFIFSNRVKAHPVEIFTVILIAASLAGVGGMIIAVPLYTVFRVIAREFFTQSVFVRKLTDEMTTLQAETIQPPEEKL
ncbi:MAG TPA: AI-2E family transporter [Bacteroidia bacterium]|nr:AI-2E family transporter [Bacteroidia bacterium]